MAVTHQHQLGALHFLVWGCSAHQNTDSLMMKIGGLSRIYRLL